MNRKGPRGLGSLRAINNDDNNLTEKWDKMGHFRTT